MPSITVVPAGGVVDGGSFTASLLTPFHPSLVDNQTLAQNLSNFINIADNLTAPLNNNMSSIEIPSQFHVGLLPDRDPMFVVLPIIIIYVLIFVTGVLGNIGTCIVIARNRSMHTATNYYLFSLAVSDFLLLISGVPQEINLIWNRYPPIYGGDLSCILRALIAEVSCNATVLTITAFTIERYLAICHPFLGQTMSKLSRAIRIIVLIWLVAIAVALVQALSFRVIEMDGHQTCHAEEQFFDHFFEVSTLVFFLVPMTLITVLYVLIAFKLRAAGGAQLMKSNEWQRRHAGNATKSQRRVLKMLVAVVVAFFFCWAPFHAQRLVAIYGADMNIEHASPNFHDIYMILTYISGVLYYLSTCINPLLYSIMSHKFREAFKAVLFRRQSGRAYSSQGSRMFRASGGGQSSFLRRGENGAVVAGGRTVKPTSRHSVVQATVPARKVSAHPLLVNSPSYS